MKGLQGKKVLITGASLGIGAACALRFAEEGADVAINYRNSEQEALQVWEQVQTHSQQSFVVKADVAKAEDVTCMIQTCLEQWGSLDMLINNAGFLYPVDSHEATLEDFDRVIGTNLRGAYHCAISVIKHWIEKDKKGVIINMSSVHQMIPKPRFLPYSISKGGMQNLTTTLALEYAERGIRVNGVAPGATITPMNDAWSDNPQKRAEVEAHIPMKRSGEAWEMAAMTAFLCSDEAAYITGQTIYIDGGLTLFADFRSSWSSE